MINENILYNIMKILKISKLSTTLKHIELTLISQTPVLMKCIFSQIALSKEAGRQPFHRRVPRGDFTINKHTAQHLNY